MKLNISEVAPGTKICQPLLHNKIMVKSTDFEGMTNGRFTTPSTTLAQMVATCLADDGIGLAAPQIGVFKRLFIIRDFDETVGLHQTFSVFFNPTWLAVREDGKSIEREGCLSVPGKSYNVERWNTIDAKWWETDDATGKPVERSERITGFRARIFQHEFQHLNAVSIVNVGSPA